MPQIGCLLVPRFPLACELAERPTLRANPAIVTHPDSTVWAVSPSAERYGIAPGQSLREAIARCPSLAVFEGRPAHYAAQMDGILAALEEAVPGAESAEEGAAYVDLHGLDRCYPSAEALWDALLRCVPRTLEPRLGIAASKFTVLVAAHRAEPGGVLAIERERAAAFLDQQPIDLLPVSLEMRRRLHLLGIETLGALAKLPPSSLLAQFGREGALAWRMARGEDDAPVRPRPWQERVVERLSFLGCESADRAPLVSRDAVLAAVEHALNRALRQQRVQGRAVRQVLLRMETERGDRWERKLTFGEALAEREPIWRALRFVLSEAELPGPIVEISLELTGLTPIFGRQLALVRAPEDSLRQKQLEETLRQLKARYGYCPVSRVVEVEPWSRIPERRLALIDLDP